MNPGDALAARVRECVAGLVPPAQVEATCTAVGQALHILLNDPTFTRELRLVQGLITENQWLKSQIIQLQRALAVATPGFVVKTPRKRKAPAKAAPGKVSAAQKKAFKQGVRQARKA